MYKLLVFGTGSGCKDFLSIVDYEKVNIIAFVDNNIDKQGNCLNNICIISPNEISKIDFDYIVITSRYFDEIYNQLLNLGVKSNKIIGFNLHYSSEFLKQINHNNTIINEFSNQTIEPYSICNLQNIGRDRKINVHEDGDFVRISSLELVANEIYDNNIEGSTAELGVFRGDFAKLINSVFHDRKLYLFDTFEGFSERDVAIEQNREFSISDINDFTNTNIDIVLQKMKYPQNCIIKKGYFPETAEDIDEQFAFVSIDADLFNPIYSGLKYFYPLLSKGGYIFIHDYNNYRFKGAKEAVKLFCMENNINCFPLSDIYGTAVIIK